MPTRHGKIARLPLTLREELNRRLQNGELSPALLPWLNQLPEVQALLAQFFAGQPISCQNLSEWRLGGYRDWLKLQERQLLIRRIAEEGVTLKQQEGKEDLFENFARIAVTELYADLDALDQLQGDDRWKRLRSLTRELACLQREYNRSREVELSWEKWNSQFEDALEVPQPDCVPAPQKRTTSVSLSSPKEDLSCLGSNERNPLKAEARRGPNERERESHWAGERSLSGFRGERNQNIGDIPQTPEGNPAPQPPVKVDPTASTEGTEPPPIWWTVRSSR